MKFAAPAPEPPTPTTCRCGSPGTRNFRHFGGAIEWRCDVCPMPRPIPPHTPGPVYPANSVSLANTAAPRSPATEPAAPTDKCGNCTHERHEHIAGLGCTHVHQPSGGYQGQMVRGCRRCEEFVEPVSPVASPATEPATEPHDALIADLLAETSRLRQENERLTQAARLLVHAIDSAGRLFCEDTPVQDLRRSLTETKR